MKNKKDVTFELKSRLLAPLNQNKEEFIEFEFSELRSDKIIVILYKNSGIYQLTNKTNGKRYIGSSINLINRVSEYGQPSYIKKVINKGKLYWKSIR